MSGCFLERAAAQWIIAAGLVCFMPGRDQGQSIQPYRSQQLPIEERVADLLSRMTLEEKIAQLEGSWQNRQSNRDANSFFVDANGAFDPGRAAIVLRNG